jgi:hypothetical protein
VKLALNHTQLPTQSFAEAQIRATHSLERPIQLQIDNDEATSAQPITSKKARYESFKPILQPPRNAKIKIKKMFSFYLLIINRCFCYK